MTAKIDTREDPAVPPKIRGFDGRRALPGQTTLEELIDDANATGKPVHLVELAHKPNNLVGAVVILRGDDTVEIFKQWANRNKIYDSSKLPERLTGWSR